MQFICRVGTQDGRVLEEVFTASDETALRSDLGKLGLHLFEVRRRGAPKLALPGLGRGGRRRIPAAEFVVFNQELAALLKAGLPLLQTLDLMLERMHNQAFKAVLTDVRDRVKSGELEQVIRRFIRYMKLVLDARRRVVSALVYPAVLVCLSIGMIAIMAVYVVPKFMSFFTELGTDLPLITQVVLSISQFSTRNWPLILLGLVVGFFALRSWGNTETGRLTLDRLKLRVPFLGPVLHRFAMSEFCRSLSTLLSGGIPLVPACEIATNSVSNAYVRSKVEPTIQLVREGKPFFSALEASGIFTDMAIDMVKVGETTGSLDDMLSSVSDFLDEQVETRMQRLLSLVEPLMLVFMGTIIAILLVSIYLPMFSMLGSSKF